MTARILVTGMSGTGKSSALAELERRGFRVVDTDRGGWCEWSDDEGGWLWVEQRMAGLLEEARDETLFVSGCVSNQGRFYDRFDAVVLLTAPAHILLARVATRAANEYGKTEAERAEILDHLSWVEPRLRATATHVLDATRPLREVADELERIAVR